MILNKKGVKFVKSETSLLVEEMYSMLIPTDSDLSEWSSNYEQLSAMREVTLRPDRAVAKHASAHMALSTDLGQWA